MELREWGEPKREKVRERERERDRGRQKETDRERQRRRTKVRGVVGMRKKRERERLCIWISRVAPSFFCLSSISFRHRKLSLGPSIFWNSKITNTTHCVR